MCNKKKALGSSSHGKSSLDWFDDILHKLPNLRWSGEGLHYRSFFNPWTAMHRLFVASITPPIFNISSIKQRLIQTCCASSHTEFLTKHPSPLWLNPSFFVSLPFKQNEDVNPTKASHPGMNPDHYQLAKEECEQLVSQGIIEPTTSPWACEAFYVNKRSEQVRGKLRLHLADAKVLSKFDLKSGFWQLAFQKAMITIFELILANTLLYIDDILLFSPDEQSHAELLSKFYSLVTKYGIMLSEKKMEVGVTTIQFLGMEISHGKYQPQPHVAQELLNSRMNYLHKR
ncbi:putative reverse transcriptase domain, viral movement protein [Tanacetum coccineum]